MDNLFNRDILEHANIGMVLHYYIKYIEHRDLIEKLVESHIRLGNMSDIVRETNELIVANGNIICIAEIINRRINEISQIGTIERMWLN